MLSISSRVIPTCACLGSGGGTMALWSSVTVLVAHPEPRSQPAIASKNNFFIARNIDPSTTIAPGKEYWNQAAEYQKCRGSEVAARYGRLLPVPDS
jgi:hypothetical protein